MKRIAIVVASFLVAGALVVPMAGSAAAGGDTRVYLGETADGGVVRFRITKTDTGREIRGFLLKTVLDCDDGTTKPLRAQLTVWGWTFEGRTAIVDENRPQEWGLRIEGTFRPLSAFGTLRYTWAHLQDDHTVLLCTTGDVAWTADRVIS